MMLPTRIPGNPAAMASSAETHLRLAMKCIPREAALEHDDQLGRAAERITAQELVAAWDIIHDVVVNTSGEPDAIKPAEGYWYHLAQAARLIISIREAC